MISKTKQKKKNKYFSNNIASIRLVKSDGTIERVEKNEDNEKIIKKSFKIVKKNTGIDISYKKELDNSVLSIVTKRNKK